MMQYLFLTDPDEGRIGDIVELYRQAGWWERRDDGGLVAGIVAGSHCFLVVQEGARIIGMGRAISDGISDAYIQDVTVHPSRRGRGIGSSIIGMLRERLAADGIKWIGLIAEEGSSPFYRRLGFSEMSAATPMLIKSDSFRPEPDGESLQGGGADGKQRTTRSLFPCNSE